MLRRIFLLICICSAGAYSQMPPIEPGVSKSLAEWRAARYSDVRYKLNLTIEKMSPVLKGTMEIRVTHSVVDQNEIVPLFLILDWRKIQDYEAMSTISNVAINGHPVAKSSKEVLEPGRQLSIVKSFKPTDLAYYELKDHLIFSDGVTMGENVIKLDFTSPILASGSAITRYIDKEDGSEYIYSLFVPSDASTAFPVFDQPDLKARFGLAIDTPRGWNCVSNTTANVGLAGGWTRDGVKQWTEFEFSETKPISTYVFAFAAGPFEKITNAGIEGRNLSGSAGAPQQTSTPKGTLPTGRVSASVPDGSIYVRRSQAAKFQPHAAEVFRLNRESIKYFEEYFDYKFPFPKYDLVLIPEFPFGGMEHAGATFLRESAIIFPQEPTKSDHISRAVLIFHEAAHQWFGDTVTMKWFDDLWLKEGFANFMAYKAVDKIMPEANAWKVFYERIKQPAYATDSTRGTTPIYQPIDNLNSAKSAYGNIVYNKAPAFLKQAEFYLGPEKFQTAVRAFLKKHEFKNAKWEDLVKEFETASRQKLGDWSTRWITQRGVPILRSQTVGNGGCLIQYGSGAEKNTWGIKVLTAINNGYDDGRLDIRDITLSPTLPEIRPETPIEKILGPRDGFCVESSHAPDATFFFPNYQDYGYGIFLLDDKSREYVLKNVQNEKDAFLRSMMYGALWDSVREAELDPRAYVEVAIKNLPTEQDETIAQMMLSRTATALNYYLSEPPAVAGGLSNGTTNSAGQSALSSSSNITRDQPPATAGGSDLRTRFESVLIDRMENATTAGQRITYFRALVANATTERSRGVLKGLLVAAMDRPRDVKAELKEAFKEPNTYVSMRLSKEELENFKKVETSESINLRTKDKFDIVTRLAVLNDPYAAKLLADLEKAETSDDAKRYAYAARAAFPTKENREKYWNDFVNNKDISESWIEAAFGPFNSVRNSELSLPYLKRALEELPNHKRSRKIFFVNGWLAAFIGGQRSQEALDIVNKFLADNPNLDRDLRLKILENVDVIERSVRIRAKVKSN